MMGHDVDIQIPHPRRSIADTTTEQKGETPHQDCIKEEDYGAP